MKAGDLWDSLSPAEQEAFGNHRATELFTEFDRLAQRVGGWSVDPTSRLAEDNASTALYRPMTQEVHYLVTSALDHLDAVATSFRLDQRIRPLAPFTLIRSATESLAFAIWLQNGGTLDKRVFRLLQMQWQQRLSVAAYGSSFGLDPSPNNRWLEAMLDQTKAQRRHLKQRDYQKPMASTTDVLIEIDHGFSPALPYGGLHAWRACSGVTHGNVHFSSGLTSVQSLDIAARGGIREIRVASIAALSMMLDPAIRYLERVVDLWETHGRARPGRPSYL